MNITWNNKWKTVLVWLSAYLNFIAFVVVGGYFYIKKEDEEVQSAAKHAFVVTLCFSAIAAFLSLFNYIGGLTDNYYASSAYNFYSVCNAVAGIAKIVVYAVFVILALIKKDSSQTTTEADTSEKE